jgi:uncharacterized protein YydD (DUF2326 family)
MPNTWIVVSKEIEGKVIPQTPVNEHYIATMKIQKLLNEGKTPEQVAKIWNGSLGGSEKAISKKGTNKKGVKYDTVAYAQKVLTNYNH